ncbi:MAG: cytochrome c biogenesis protein CcdA [Rhodospirillales bacterium]|nr:MAG: cytochrome c biogenesis protein CcdA [Rhodospirillales bacterium]
MVGLDATYYGAFVAGMLSFLSPCILPLVPPYLCFLGGVSLKQLEDGATVDRAASLRVVLSSVVFVLGFATVFIAFGATASALGQIVADNIDLLAIIAGIVIIALGLHFLGLFRIGFLYREARFHVERKPAGVIGAYVVGLAFAFGWTPCVGPVLAAILMVAASDDSAYRGAALLAAYAAGIGVPFIGAALFAPLFLRFMARFRRHIVWVERILGALLVATGILFLTGGINDIGNWLLETFPQFGKIG